MILLQLCLKDTLFTAVFIQVKAFILTIQYQNLFPQSKSSNVNIYVRILKLRLIKQFKFTPTIKPVKSTYLK